MTYADPQNYEYPMGKSDQGMRNEDHPLNRKRTYEQYSAQMNEYDNYPP